MLTRRLFPVALAVVCLFSQAALATKISLGFAFSEFDFTDYFEITDQNFKTTTVSVQSQAHESSGLRAQKLKEAIDQAVMNHLINVTVSVTGNEVSLNSTNFTFRENGSSQDWKIFLESNDRPALSGVGGWLNWLNDSPLSESAYFGNLFTSTTSYGVQFQTMDLRRSGLTIAEYAKNEFERQGATGFFLIDGNLAFSNAYIGFSGSGFNSRLIGSLNASPVLEPSTCVLTALGLAGMGIVTSRKSRRLLQKPFGRV